MIKVDVTVKDVVPIKAVVVKPSQFNSLKISPNSTAKAGALATDT